MDATRIGQPPRSQSGPIRLTHWFCAYCGVWFFAPTGADPDHCPTEGCSRPFGFGAMSRVRLPEAH